MAVRTDYASLYQEVTYDVSGEPSGGRLSGAGVVLFCIGALFFGSALKATRLEVGSFLLHPSLVLVVPALIPALGALHRITTRVIPAAVALVCAVVLGALMASGNAGWLSLVVKIGAALAYMVVGAVLPKSTKDIQAAALGIGVAAIVMAGRVLIGTDASLSGADMMEEAGKNTYSLYALPAVLLFAYFLLGYRASRTIRLLFAFGLLSLLASILVSGNRSGWVGAALVLIALFMCVPGSSSRARMLVFAAIAAVAVGYLVTSVGQGEAVVQRKYEETVQGTYKSDDKRVDLALEALRVGLKHPLLGAGRKPMEESLARAVAPNYPRMSPHNLTAFVFGAWGSLGLVTLFWFLSEIWQTPRYEKLRDQFIINPRTLVRIAVLLFFVRGQFQEAALWNPPMIMLLGLTIALNRVAADEGAALKPNGAGP